MQHINMSTIEGKQRVVDDTKSPDLPRPTEATLVDLLIELRAIRALLEKQSLGTEHAAAEERSSR